MKLLIACEESGIVRESFRSMGINAYSCDLLQSSIPSLYHFQCDIFELLENEKFDAMIAHPPCERLTVAANKYYLPQYADRFPNIHKERKAAIEFFLKLATYPIKHKAIENPIGIMSKLYRKPNQIIQPFWFGDGERKATCLWLEGLPNLQPTNIVQPDIIIHKSGRTDSRLHFETLKLPPIERRKARSKTFPGIAAAMAKQWSEYINSIKQVA